MSSLEEEKYSGWFALLAIVNAFAILPFVASVYFRLWNWFITPHFPNTLNRWQVMGIALIFAYTQQVKAETSETMSEKVLALINPWFRGGVVLLAGYIYSRLAA